MPESKYTRNTTREEYFYRLGQYEEAKFESIDDKHVQQLHTVVKNLEFQLS
jgi:hypothetical protein